MSYFSVSIYLSILIFYLHHIISYHNIISYHADQLFKTRKNKKQEVVN